jgi:hypothetical protein
MHTSYLNAILNATFNLFGPRVDNTGISDLRECLLRAAHDNKLRVAFPDEPFYQLRDVKRWNLDIKVTPAAVTYPRSTKDVEDIVSCAAASRFYVQAKGGGHSFGNYGKMATASSLKEY